MAQSNRDRVGRGLELLTEGVAPFVERIMAPTVDQGRDWTEVLAERRGNRASHAYNREDPQTWLRVITEERPFRDKLSHVQRGFAQELRDVRNSWAHGRAFTDNDTSRALDSMVRLCQAVGAVPQAEALTRMLYDHQQAFFAKHAGRAAKATVEPGVAGSGLKPWREVIKPHPDVATGNFSASEFAADLAQVARGEARDEYGDPVEFFRRTYLTEGLRDLLGKAVRRIGRDPNADPVINLQTNFGGGKTHSMLALWHAFSGKPLTAYPQDMQELLAGSDLAALGADIRRVALVGDHLSPSLGMPKPDGTMVQTIWGELAWQLGGRPAYTQIAEADRTGTNPGEALSMLIAAYSPCLILIDEWVAYARQLADEPGALPAGTFDTQFTFAQYLTEAVKATPGALLVISIPASDRGEADDGGAAIEVGGPRGQDALARLQNVVGRVASQWRSASQQESFEIVRRRLFEEPDGEARTHIAAVARRFTQFYADHRLEFPANCSEPAYEARIRAAYPVHPELFDRLYIDWSTLDRFQRTRGVLRLMSKIIFASWQAHDPAPLIMPGNVQLEDLPVLTELTQYLEDSWKPVVDADIDGPESTPVRIDIERTTFGQRRMTRRLARTMFLGSAATLRSAHKGIDQQRIWLGSAVPGDTVGNFGSALHVLADRATYLYSESGRYWYDTQPSVTRTARDYAERLHPEDVWAEIIKRLRASQTTVRGKFAAVHPAPESTGDVPDVDDARLVVLHPRYTHRRGEDKSSAVTFVTELLAQRGTAQRVHRNMLVCLAADTRAMEDLMAASREYLAWRQIGDRHEELGLGPAQQRQARNRIKEADQAVDLRIGTAYIWALLPEPPAADKPDVIKAVKADGSSALAERVSTRLVNDGTLGIVHAPTLIRMRLDGPLKSVWDLGHIPLGELWGYYTRYPYLPRLRDRQVLDHGVEDVLNLVTWEREGFALATGYDESTGRYTGLVIPGGSASFAAITDSTLLVRPDRALAQRELEEIARKAATPKTEDDPGATVVGPGLISLPRPEPETPEPKPTSHFFGVYRTRTEFYAKELNRLQTEVLAHLARAGELELTIEITARKPDGYADDEIRTISENARVLKFEQARFEEE
ncbi:AAA family ATPase [Plantactinospora sp. BC1]|uniref:Swt1 family HEPN domain-containing protein n=1 Tax=Plantactinospora sp. BC1 TaxID=2108470 RepID=UPI000D156E6D|nr:Swt1 family HEPN domain-containing protein [Plantactinospora sp. BC1]AVT32673.1 AAA family ATPase [Plantactinospora sp. BC1]